MNADAEAVVLELLAERYPTRDALAVAAEVGWAAPAKATGHVARVAWGDED